VQASTPKSFDQHRRDMFWLLELFTSVRPPLFFELQR